MPTHRLTVPLTPPHAVRRSYQGPGPATHPSPSRRSERQGELGDGPAGAQREVLEGGRLPVEGLEDRLDPPASGTGRRSAAGRRPPGTSPEGHQHVVGVADRVAAVGQELVGARRRRAADRAGHRHDVDPAVDRLADREQRAAGRVGLDDDHDVGSAAMMRLRAGNRHGAGRMPSGASPSSTPALADRRPQLAVPRRVGLVVPAADDPDRRQRRRRRAASSTPRWAAPSMPERQPGHHRARPPRPARARAPGPPPRPLPVQRAGADDADPGPGQRGEVALGEQHGRRVGVLAQRVAGRRVVAAAAATATPAVAVGRCPTSSRVGPGRCVPSCDPAPTPPPATSGRRRRRRADAGPGLGSPARQRGAPVLGGRRSSAAPPRRPAPVPSGRPAGPARRPRARRPTSWGPPSRSATVRATRRTRCRPRARQPPGPERRPRGAAWRVSDSGATSSRRLAGMSALVRTPRSRREARAPRPPGRPRRRWARRWPAPKQVVDRRAGAPRRAGRTGRAAGPTADGGSAARAASEHRQPPGRLPSPHGHGFIAATRRNRAGIVTDATARADPHHPFLQRLAQRVEHPRRELGELVEEQDPVGTPR